MYQLIIIDDEPKIAEGIAMLFPWEESGFHVAATFTSAVQALEYLRAEKADVVLSDIQMPDLSGIELCRELQDTGVEVVLFSSHQDYEYFRSAIQLGVTDYLLKPISYPKLLECFTKIRERLDAERHVEQEMPQGYYEQILSRVEAYLSANLQNATLGRCSERVNLSPTYLSRIIKERTGKTFSDRLMQLRMEKARELLNNPDYKGYDIAYDLGYDNPKNFSRAFKNYWGCSPREYRQQRKEEVTE